MIKVRNTSVRVIRKRRVRKHIISDLSANYAERFALLNGFSVEKFITDYGYDLSVHTYNADGEPEAGYIYIQLKATDRPKYLKNNLEIALTLSKKDIATWLNEILPVILILYDAENERAYWLYVQQRVKKLSNFNLNTISDNYNVRIPLANMLNAESFRSFQAFKTNILNLSSHANAHY